MFVLSLQVSMSVVVANVTLVDNGVGIISFIFAPPSLSHMYSNKTVHIQVRGWTAAELLSGSCLCPCAVCYGCQSGLLYHPYSPRSWKYVLLCQSQIYCIRSLR